LGVPVQSTGNQQASLRIANGRVSLQSILITEELSRRPSRPPDYEAENHALAQLAREMANSPRDILQRLVEVAMKLCKAHSAGVSLLRKEEGQEVFRWDAVAGQFAVNLGGSIARDLSPCGVVLDRNSVLLFGHPERHYDYPVQIDPPIVEALLVPFHVGVEPIGTIWVIAHDDDCKFDAEDARVLQSLGIFASSAYQLLHSLDVLKREVSVRQEKERELGAGERALRESNLRAAADLRAMTLLHDLGSLCAIAETPFERCLEAVAGNRDRTGRSGKGELATA
jgi:GAF domain-containing protein